VGYLEVGRPSLSEDAAKIEGPENTTCQLLPTSTTSEKKIDGRVLKK
jgi:hypothetical protein